MTQEDKPIAIILPNWNPNEPRFIVEDAHDELADDRAFRNGKCVYNQRVGVVYTVEYIVDALNELGDEIDKLKEENEQLKSTITHLEEECGARENDIVNLKKENEQLKEQNRKYCSILVQSNQEYRKDNRELRQELNDCEKFRHSIFKRMNELTNQLKEKEEDEKLYAQEIVELNKTKKELIEFNELGGDY